MVAGSGVLSPTLDSPIRRRSYRRGGGGTKREVFDGSQDPDSRKRMAAEEGEGRGRREGGNPLKPPWLEDVGHPLWVPSGFI